MKIGLVCPYNLWKGGGVQECCLALQKELSNRGHTVKILAPQPREITEEDVDGSQIILVGNSTTFKSLHTTGVISIATKPQAIDALLAEENFDVLHFHEPWLPMVSRQILSRSTSANVATSHATLPDGLTSKAIINLSNSYTKSLTKYIDVYTAVSPSAAEYISGHTGEKIHIVPNGIDLTSYTPLPPSANAHKNILYIGRLEKRKGVVHLLEAFKRLSKTRPDVRLNIAGDGPLREKLREWVDEHRLKGVTFLGYVSEKKKHRLLSDADLFCSPALYGESFGIVLLEAMAMGVVTVAGNNAGYGWVMKGEGSVSLVDPTDTTAFAKKLELLLFDETRRKKWLNWAEEYVKQYDFPKVADQYEAIYKTAIKNKAHRRKKAE